MQKPRALKTEAETIDFNDDPRCRHNMY